MEMDTMSFRSFTLHLGFVPTECEWLSELQVQAVVEKYRLEIFTPVEIFNVQDFVFFDMRRSSYVWRFVKCEQDVWRAVKVEVPSAKSAYYCISRIIEQRYEKECKDDVEKWLT